MPKKNFIIAAALALAGPWAWGQTVYRCGNSYSQQPCPGAVAIDAAHAGTPQDAARAQRAAAVDMKRAQEMEKARLAQEKSAPKAIIIGPEKAEAAPVKDKRGTAPKAGKPEQFTAVAPGTGKPKKAK